MPCDTRLKPGQTIKQRADEVRKAVENLNQGLATGAVRVKVGPQGAVAFEGWGARDSVTDNCAYRRLMSTGSSAAKLAIARAEQLAGRPINRAVVNSGAHSHDGGLTWHQHKG